MGEARESSNAASALFRNSMETCASWCGGGKENGLLL